MTNENFDIETALQQDTSGEYKTQLLGELNDEAFRLRERLSVGVHPEAYQKLEALLKATEAAGEVVDRIWQQSRSH